MRFVVIGGGIAGLTAGFRLVEHAPAGAEVTVLEAGSAAGGHARTLREDGFLVETGPNALLERAAGDSTSALLRDLGLTASLLEARPAARRRFVVRGGRLRRVPASPPALLASDALTVAGRLRVLAEPFARPAPSGVRESVYEFARRRLGREAAEVLVDAAVAGISAGESRTLDMAAAFPELLEMERAHGSLLRAMLAHRGPRPRLVSPASGMGAIAETLAARLGSRLKTGACAERLERAGAGWRVTLAGGEALHADRVVLAIAARRAAPLLAGADPELARVLGGFAAAGVAVVALAFRARDVGVPLDGYGYLVTREEGLDTLGVVWESSLFANRAPADAVLVRAIMGGARRPRVAAAEPPQLVRTARTELARVLGVGAPTLRTWVSSWPEAITQYGRDHLAAVARTRERAAAHPGLELCGTSYDGVSFAAAIVSAERAVRRALAAPAPCRDVAAGAAAPAHHAAEVA